MTTLSDLLQAGYDGIGQLRFSTATGGSTTTIEDTGFGNSAKADGTAFITYDAGDAGVAPEGEYSRISTVTSAGVITVSDAFTVAPASGDDYAYAGTSMNLPTGIAQVNKALREIGNMGVVDSSLTSAANQTEYALPLAAKHDLRIVEYQGKTGDSDDNRWIKVSAWEITPAAAGSTGLLKTNQQLPDGRTIRLTYVAPHPTISVFGDLLQEAVPRQLAEARVVFKFFDYLNNLRQNSDPTVQRGYNKALQNLEFAEAKYLIWTPKQKAKTTTLPEHGRFYNRRWRWWN